MKKFVLILMLTMGFMNVSVWADTIINAPIDGRPISNEYLNNLAKIANDEVYSVSKSNLDFYATYEPDNRLAKSDNVRKEIYDITSKNNNENTTVIINTSSYVTNGLVGSRCGNNYENYKEAVADLKKLSTDFTKPYYYVNVVLPRSLPENRFNKIWYNDEKLDGLGGYYLKHNSNCENYAEINEKYSKVTPTQYLMEVGYVYNKAEEIGAKALTPWEKDFLDYFNKNIRYKEPYKPYIDNYLRPYEATASMFKLFVQLQKNGLIDEIVISQDDLQTPDFINYCNSKKCDWIQNENGSPIKYSFARIYIETGISSITNTISKSYSKTELNKAKAGKSKIVNIIYGTDEVPQLIYARDYTRRMNLTPKTKLMYNDVTQDVSTFDVKKPGNIARAAVAFVNNDVDKYTKNNSAVYIYDYTNNADKSAVAIEALRLEKKNGSNIGLIELFSPNKKNTVFEDILNSKKGVKLSDLDMYSAWNTNGNAIGLGIAHSQVISIAKEVSKNPSETALSQRIMLAQHIIEDGMYTKYGKLALVNKAYRPSLVDRENSRQLANILDVNKVTNKLEGECIINGVTCDVSELEVSKLSFPWGRTFDIFVQFKGNVTEVKE